MNVAVRVACVTSVKEISHAIIGDIHKQPVNSAIRVRDVVIKTIGKKHLTFRMPKLTSIFNAKSAGQKRSIWQGQID